MDLKCDSRTHTSRSNGAWSSPFVRWQGPAAELSSLDVAAQVTERALRERDDGWDIDELVLGFTVPQRQSFYGAPTLAARLGLGAVTGPLIMQACATSVACVHAAAAGGDGVRLVVVTDRTSNGPHVVYPSPGAPGGTPASENWVLDSFGCDPNTGEGMLATAERVAAQGAFTKAEIDAVTARRWSQYEDALSDDRAFQQRWMVPITAGSKRKPVEIDADWGIRPAAARDPRSAARGRGGRRRVLRLADASGRRLRGADRHVAARRPGGPHPRQRLRARGARRDAQGARPRSGRRARRRRPHADRDRRHQDPQPVRGQRPLVRARNRRRRRRHEPVRLQPDLRSPAGARPAPAA